MNALGALMAVAGIAGFALNYMGIIKKTGLVGNPMAWAILGIIGIVIFLLTSRPSD